VLPEQPEPALLPQRGLRAGSGQLRSRLIRRIGGIGASPDHFREALRGVAVDGERVYAVGDSALKLFGREGEFLAQWATARPGECVALDGDGRSWVGEWKQVEIFDAKQGLVSSFRDPERLGRVTAIGFARGEVFMADVLARCIHRYDAGRRFLNHIGDRHRKGGFDIPNGVVDLALDRDGEIHAANPGMHRVERYAADGRLVSQFGRFDEAGEEPGPSIVGRGFDVSVGVPFGAPLSDGLRHAARRCAEACPTGAIALRAARACDLAGCGGCRS
jgi:hypothetical protein